MSKPTAVAHKTLTHVQSRSASQKVLRAFDCRLAQLESEVRALKEQAEHRHELTATPVYAEPQPAAADPAPKNRAQRVLEDFRRTHARWYFESDANVAERLARTEEARQSWISERLLVPPEELAQAWNRTRQALEHACKRNELFSLKINNRRWYPALFTRLAAEDVARVNKALAGGDAVSKLLFWHRKHGALDGGTLEEALLAGKVARAEELARGLAQESGWRPVNAVA